MYEVVQSTNAMSFKATLLASLILSVLLGCSACMTQLAGDNTLSSTAISTFEVIHSAEESGADIGGLVSQYNSLLQDSAPDTAFGVIMNQAVEAQKSVLAARSLDNLLTQLLIPVIAFILSFITTGSLRLRKRLAKERMLDSEIRIAR